jgi:hypothetical protein
VITKIKILLSGAVAANQTIVPKIVVDDGSTTTTLTTINSTNYANSERNIVMRPAINGKHNFYIQLEFTGTDQISVLMPIVIEGEIKDD